MQNNDLSNVSPVNVKDNFDLIIFIVVHAWSNLFQFIEGQTYFSACWHAKVSLILNEPYRMFYMVYLQASTKNVVNMEVVVWKPTNCRPTSHKSIGVALSNF
jgi:hypothetical protein